jgi:iron complex outermembrane recepter protein
MKSYHYKNMLFITAVLFWLPLITLAQQTPIKITDAVSSDPLSFVHFTYGTQKGSADLSGVIHIDYILGEKLQLSHVSYGIVSFSDKEVKQAIETGILAVEGQRGVNLQPVTIIALHPERRDKQTMQLNYRQHLSHDAGLILQHSPFISGIRKSNSYGFDPVMRGFKYDQLNIVVDGVQGATAACPNRMDPPTSQVSPNMTERIEVLKGPFSLRYGNSFGGTINFIGGKPAFSSKTKYSGRLSSGYESNGAVFNTEAFAGISTKKINLRLFGAWANGHDYQDGSGESVAAAFNRGNLGTKVAYQINANQLLEGSVTRNRSRDVDFPSLPMDLRRDDALLVNLGHQMVFYEAVLQKWQTSLYGTWVDHYMDNLLKPIEPRNLNASTAAETKNYGGRTEFEFIRANHRVFSGLDVKIEEAKGIRERAFIMGPNAGKTFYDNAWQNGKISRSGLFFEYRYALNDYMFVASTRLELNHAMVLDGAEEFIAIYPETTVKQFNPSISLGVTKYWSGTLSGSVWLGRAQRSAGLSERYINYFPIGIDPYEMLGNPNLKPEVNNQADFSLDFNNKSTSLSIGVFAAYLQNYISSVIDTNLSTRLPSSPGVRQFINLDKAMLSGFEFSMKQAMPASLMLEIAMAYTHGVDLSQKKPLPEIPPIDLRLTLSGNYFGNRLFPELMLRYAGAQNRVAASFAEQKTPAFTLVDMGLTYQINSTVSLNAGIKNLFDEAYYEHLSRGMRTDPPRPLYAPGRSFFLKLNLNFL